MYTRSLNASNAEAKIWWQAIDEQLGLFISVVATGQEIPNSDVEAARTYIEARLPQIVNLETPTQLQDVHQQIIAALENMKQSLEYRLQRNDLVAQSRYEIARVNMDSVRFHLLQFNIIL